MPHASASRAVERRRGARSSVGVLTMMTLVAVAIVARAALARGVVADDVARTSVSEDIARDAALGVMFDGQARARGMASLNAKRGDFAREDAVSFAALGAAKPQIGAAQTDFERYLLRHGKTKHQYCLARDIVDQKSCAAAVSRAETSFRRNSRIVAQHNADPRNTYKLRVNKFADVDVDDFTHKRYNYQARPTPKNHIRKQNAQRLAQRVKNSLLGIREAEVESLQKNFNWADVPGVMGRVHNQKSDCASCWAYVTSDILESLLVINKVTKTHEELAVDELINCDTYDSGCSTGNMFTAFEWIEGKGGIATESDFEQRLGVIRDEPKIKTPEMVTTHSWDDQYTTKPQPYFEDDSTNLESNEALELIQRRVCNAMQHGTKRVSPVYGYCELSLAGGEKELMQAVSRSPVAIGLNANKKFQLYDSGILRMKDCPPAPHTRDTMYMSINHAALLTGWGEEELPSGEVVKYWVIKNSFGEDWGEDGYFRIERGPVTSEGLGTCGVYFESVYPIVKKQDAISDSHGCVPGATFRKDYYRSLIASSARQGEHQIGLVEQGMSKDSTDARRIVLQVVACTVMGALLTVVLVNRVGTLLNFKSKKATKNTVNSEGQTLLANKQGSAAAHDLV